MSAILPVIRQLLVDEGIEPVKIYHMDDGVRIGVLLLDPPSGAKIDAELPGYRASGFQVVVRHEEYRAGEALAKRISDVLKTERRKEVSGVVINFVHPRHEPIVFPRSGGGRLEFSVNFDASYVI